MTITAAIAIDIASQLPREIQDLILPNVVLRYHSFYNFEDTNKLSFTTSNSDDVYDNRDVLIPLISLINLSDPLVDYVVFWRFPN
ncbi:unnamed protein product [Ambrosiozyma monospora]|uniref:Unnamed protein product n=1 Tax=Ambrosiozyma monospora TaxID=43982 RepID=A0ACB5T6X2_AMBMO|nr:unnamed protein product [Ambrosiozyma monospora]